MATLSIGDLARESERMQRPELLAPGIAAGRVSLFVLGPKGGKSTTAAGTLRDAGKRGHRGKLISIDEHPNDSLQRLIRIGADADRIFMDETPEFIPDKECMNALRADIKQLGLQLVVLDHLHKLAQAHPDFGVNSQHDAVLWGRLCSAFSDIARETGVGVVLLDQARRDGEWSGNHGKAGQVDDICVLHPDARGLTCNPRGRSGLPPFRVDLDANGAPVFSELQSNTAGQEAATEEERLQVLAILRDAVPGDMSATEWQRVAKERHVGRSLFYQIQGDLHRRGMVESRKNGRSVRYGVAAAGWLALESAGWPPMPGVESVPAQHSVSSRGDGENMSTNPLSGEYGRMDISVPLRTNTSTRPHPHSSAPVDISTPAEVTQEKSDAGAPDPEPEAIEALPVTEADLEGRQAITADGRRVTHSGSARVVRQLTPHELASVQSEARKRQQRQRRKEERELGL